MGKEVFMGLIFDLNFMKFAIINIHLFCDNGFFFQL